MSSHHIVREKQEPALLVLGLDNFTDDELGQLLEWSPTLIASLPIAEQLAIYGIKIDYVISAGGSAALQSDVKVIDPAGKSPLQAALAFLTSNGYPSVNIVTNDFELPVYETYATQINLVIFNNRQKIYAVTPGYRKWKPAGEVITLLSHTPSVKTQGLAPTNELNYRTQTDGFFSIDFSAPFIFIGEEL